MVAIDTLSGVAIAKTTGRTAIYHKIKDVVDTHTEVCVLINDQHSMFTIQVTVVKVHNISIDSQSEVFTNVMTSQEYHVMLTFNHKDGPFTPILATTGCYSNSTGMHDATLNTQPVYLQQVGFDCLLTVKSPTHPQISQSDVAKAVAVFNNRSGKSYCHLMPTSNSATQRLLSIFNDVTMTLQVVAYDFDHLYTVSPAPVRIPFMPSFVLRQQQIKVGSCDHSTEIEVWGTKDQLTNLQVFTLCIAHLHSNVILQVSTEDNTLIIAPPVFDSATKAVYTISRQNQENHVISESSPKLVTVNFISLLTGQSSQLTVMSSSHGANCVSQSQHSADNLISATPPTMLHKVPILQQVSTFVGDEMIVVMVTGIVVLLGFLAVCCSLWRHGNSSSTNQSGFSSHVPSATSSTPQPLPPVLMTTPSSTACPGTSPRQPHQRAASAFTPTNNSPHYTLYNQ